MSYVLIGILLLMQLEICWRLWTWKDGELSWKLEEESC